MPIETIEFKGKEYPKLQSEGFAAKFAFPFAQEICKGFGVDIGYSRTEWKFHNTIGVDYGKLLRIDGVEVSDEKISAYNFAGYDFDFIVSSHCVEHLPDYVAALDYWSTKLKPGGVLFLYLPNMDYQQYWQPENNRKHVHYISPKVMQSYFNNRTDMWTKVMVTEGYDLNGSFYAIAEKA